MAEALMVNTAHALSAFTVYASREGSCSGGDRSRTDDYATDLVDFIADLLHLADTLDTRHGRLGNGGEGAAASALNHYRHEIDGD
jgi:hypothetical protein